MSNSDASVWVLAAVVAALALVRDPNVWTLMCMCLAALLCKRLRYVAALLAAVPVVVGARGLAAVFAFCVLTLARLTPDLGSPSAAAHLAVLAALVLRLFVWTVSCAWLTPEQCGGTWVEIAADVLVPAAGALVLTLWTRMGRATLLVAALAQWCVALDYVTLPALVAAAAAPTLAQLLWPSSSSNTRMNIGML